MLNRTYRILKYIYKHPRITKAKLLEKFRDFEKYQSCISEYVIVENESKDREYEIMEKLILKAGELGLSIGEQCEYVNANMPENLDNSVDNSLIFYSANNLFQLEIERRRRDARMFWVPYTITTVIAIISAAPTIYEIFNFILQLFLKI